MDDIEDRVPNQFQSWMVGLQWRDMPLEGSDPGFAMGQPQFVTQLEGGDTPFDATTPGNLWYQFQVTDNISVTPALFYLSRPQGNLAGPTYDNSFSMFGGLVQTTSSSEPMAIAPGITALVGCAPLARLHRSPAAEGCRAELAAKLDGFNPTASLKDRIAGTMAEAAAREGRISPGRTVLAEPTNGNTGAALAMVAAARGYRLILTIVGHHNFLSVERRAMPQGLWRWVAPDPRPRGDGWGDRSLARELPEAYLLQQFANPANSAIHAATTAEEIWRDYEGRVDCLIAGVGAGGTLTGCGCILKQRCPSLRLGAMESDPARCFQEGAPGPIAFRVTGAGFVPPVLARSMIDEYRNRE